MPKYTINNFSGGQVNNRGPFNVDANEARLSLNTDLSKRDGSIKRRDGYTQLGSAISSNILNGMGVFSFNSGSNITVNYTADDLPAAATPAWTKNGGDTATEGVDSGILTLTDAAGDAISSDETQGSMIILKAHDATGWWPYGRVGAWADAN